MEYRKNPLRLFLFASLLLCLLTGLTGIARSPEKVEAAPQMQGVSHIVISQIYGGGGNSGAPYQNDYVELFNPSDVSLPLNGFSIQYAPSTGAGLFSDNVTPLTLSGLLAPGQFYLVQLAGGSNGLSLPTPDASGSTNMSAGDGKVVLVNNTTGLACNGGSTPCIDLSNVVDLVGYGNANFYEGAGAAPGPKNNTTSILRNSNGCFDSNNNGVDFATGTPNPRNTGFGPITSCSTPTATSTATSTGTATSTATDTGTPTNTGTVTNTPTATATATNTSTPATGSATSVVISEFRTAGSDEFIEIYNPTNNWVDISGWKINGSNSSGTEQTRATIPAGTILRPGQYYLIATRSSFTISTGTITANLTYGTSIADDGGIALFNSIGQIVDEVGMHAGSAYQEGSILAPLANANRSYERLDGDPLGSCTDTNNNRDDFEEVSPSPHNSSTRRSCNGTSGPTLISTTTLITADSPDPSLINGNVSVSVRVTGSSLSPNGTKVYITGANTNCTITLNSSGTGSCNVKFTTTGTKTITATFIGDNTHSSSSDTESHTVSTTSTIRTATPSRIPTLPPPPQLVAINEFVPRPGHDWNYDGEVNVRDEYIEIINHGVVNVNLSGYSLDDEVNIGSAPYRLPAVTIRPGERLVFYGSETGLLLSDGGDGVRLLKPNGQLADAYNYTVARYSDQSYCRLPDNGGLDDWNQNCYPTPGLQNSLSGGLISVPNGVNEQSLCPIADTLPEDFVIAECAPYGNNIWSKEFWDAEGWYNEKIIPGIQSRWDVFAD